MTRPFGTGVQLHWRNELSRSWQSGSGSHPGAYACATPFVSARGAAAALSALFQFPSPKHRVVRIVCGELQDEKGEANLKGAWAPVKAVFGGAAVTAPPAILNAGPAARVLCEEGHPQGQLSVHHITRCCAYGRVILDVEGPEVVILKRRWLRECTSRFDISCEGGRPGRRRCTGTTGVTEVATFQGA